MKKGLFFLFLITFIVSCNSVNTQSENETVGTEIVEPGDVKPTHFAELEIKGMMCQKGCGSVIRKGLYETGGVSEVEINFDEDNPISKIKVYYDQDKLSIEDMISAIGSLANNRYTATLNNITETTIQ